MSKNIQRSRTKTLFEEVAEKSDIISCIRVQVLSWAWLLFAVWNLNIYREFIRADHVSPGYERQTDELCDGGFMANCLQLLQ